MTHHLSQKLEWGGYLPGVIGKVTELHAVYYHEHWNFDISFESQVGKELSEFFIQFNPQSDGFWTICVEASLAGCIAIDGRAAQTEGARLRWFIVNPGLQGLGIGKRLLTKAVNFSKRAGHRNVFLWTFAGLDTARGLYERQGFTLTEEHALDQWGASISEQKFELRL